MAKTKRLSPMPARSLELQAKLFRGFADQSRLSILDALRGGPLPVGEIVVTTGLSQPNVSNHLRCLSECGLVASEQEGRFVIYRLNDPLIGDLFAIVDQLMESTAPLIDDCKNYKARS